MAPGPDEATALLDHLADSATSAEDAYTVLDAKGFGDGLPVVGLTPLAVDGMVGETAVGPDETIASVRPLRGELTARRLAVCALLAGARPEHMPVLVAAVKALEAPELNALGVLSTTSNAAFMVVVSGPAAVNLGFNSGANCLGPGNRSNAVVGRCLSLVTRIVGGAREGHADMATMGQPAKYSFCFAENDEASPWEPLHVDRGLTAEQSAVTVMGIGGCVEAFESYSYAPDDMVDSLAPVMAHTAPIVNPSLGLLGGGFPAVIVSPEWAHAFAAAGMSRANLKERLYRAARLPNDDRLLTIAADPEDIVVVVAGGPGVKQTVVPGWAGGSAPVTREVSA
jgi:hypothetical protein